MKTENEVFQAKETHVQWPRNKKSKATHKEQCGSVVSCKKAASGVVGITGAAYVRSSFECRLRYSKLIVYALGSN